MTLETTITVGAALFCLVGTVHGQCQQELLASDGQAGDYYGAAVAVDGDTAMIGAPFRSATGAAAAGAVYVEARGAAGWVEVQRLVASDGFTGDGFGSALAIDGARAVVGAPFADTAGQDAGAVYVFERVATGWTEVAKLVVAGGAAFDRFGAALALEGDRVLVGAPQNDFGGAGAAYVFERSASAWSQTAELVAIDGAANDLFGAAVDLAGTLALIGAPQDDDLGFDSGSAYVFEPAGGAWVESAKLLAAGGEDSARFGSSVSLAGVRALVGAPLATGVAFREGAAFVFEPIATGWVQTAVLADASGQAFDGFGLAVSWSGERALVGASQNVASIGDDGYAVLFDRTGTGWLATSRLTASDGAILDNYGAAVALDGDTGVIGAAFHDHSGDESGAAYAYSFAAIGTSYCVATPSSSGVPAAIAARGSETVAANCVTLLATDLPQGQFGYFLASRTQGFVQPPLSQGNLCLSGSIARFVEGLQSSGSAGAMAIEVDLTSIPGLGAVVAGETWSFQGWFRDQNPGTTSNFTDGVEVLFD